MIDDENALDLSGLTNSEIYEIKEAVSKSILMRSLHCQKVTSSTNVLKGGQLKLESFLIF